MAPSSSPGVDRVSIARAGLVLACLAVALGARHVLVAAAPEVLARHGDDAVLVVRRVALTLAGVLAFGPRALRWLRSPRFAARFVAPSSARELGAIRVVVAAITGVSLALEPVPTTTRLPAELYGPVGFMAALELVPGFAFLRRSHEALTVVWLIGVVACLAAALGLHTRRTVPMAAILALVLGGVLRGYTHVFHLALMPALLLLVLAFAPSGDACSLDARAGRTSSSPAHVYAYVRFAVVANLALAYAAAGFSKLVRGGLAWPSAPNMQRILLESSLDPLAVGARLPSELAMPATLSVALGACALVLELAMPLVLVRGLPGRVLLPLAAIGMHLGILALQGIFFPDLITLDILLAALLVCERAHDAPSLVRPRAARPWPALVFVPLVVGLAGIEAYPLTAWPMFSSADRSGVAIHHRVYAETVHGRAPLDVLRCFPALHDGRHRDLVRWAIDGSRRIAARAALVACARATSDEASPTRHVVVERLRAEFTRHPHDRIAHEVVARVVLPVSAGRASSLLVTRSQP